MARVFQGRRARLSISSGQKNIANGYAAYPPGTNCYPPIGSKWFMSCDGGQTLVACPTAIRYTQSNEPAGTVTTMQLRGTGESAWEKVMSQAMDDRSELVVVALFGEKRRVFHPSSLRVEVENIEVNEYTGIVRDYYVHAKTYEMRGVWRM